MAKRATTKSTKAKRAPTIKVVREAAFACETLEQAAERLGRSDLAKLLETRPRLAAAWERGRLLRCVADVARHTYVIAERADKVLNLPPGTFGPIYRTDRVVRELWDRNRFALMLEAEKTLAARVHEGDAKAVAAVQHLFGHRDTPATDFGRLTITELAEATDIDRRQIWRWVRDHGLPRNADQTFRLSTFIRWHGKWERDKVTGGAEAVGLNPMQAEKARLYKMQADEAQGRLIARDTVAELLCVRAARMVQVFGESRAEEWAEVHAGQTAGQLKDAYMAAFREVRRIWATWPGEIELAGEVRGRLEALLSDIAEAKGA